MAAKARFQSIIIAATLLFSMSVSPLFGGSASWDKFKKAEQLFKKANELLRQMDYDSAIEEYTKVILLLPDSKVSQDARYWIGQDYFRAGQYDRALSAFTELINEHSQSAIVPVSRLMVERAEEAIQDAKSRKAMDEAKDKEVVVDPATGIRYDRTRTFVGKRDVIEHAAGLSLSPDGRFLLSERRVIPIDQGDPFDLIETTAFRGVWSPDGKNVAFYSGDAICVMPVSAETARPTGSVRKIIEGAYKFQYNVSWSPDGTRLAFARREKDSVGASNFLAALGNDIWTIGLDGGELTQITNTPEREYGCAWSPDGERIAYGKEYRSIWISAANGEKAEMILDIGHKGNPIWSPDGKWIVVMEWEKMHLIQLSDRRRQETVLPPEVGSFIGWSPDKRKMVFYRPSYRYKYSLNVVSASGGPSLELGKGNDFYGVGQWTPDSRKIVAQGENEDGEVVFWIIPLSGAKPMLLEIDIGDNGIPFPFAVSPEMNKLAFIIDQENKSEDLYMVPISLEPARTAGLPVKVFDGWLRAGGYNATASWAPDGSKIAIIHKEDVWIVSTDGDKPKQITRTAEKERWPGWSPDGNMLIFAAGTNTDRRAFYVAPAVGSIEPNRLVGYGQYDWSPDGKKIVTSIGGKISVVYLDGRRAQEIAALEDLGLDKIFSFSWSPDGKKIAFVGNHMTKGHAGPIYLIPAEGGAVNNLAEDDAGWKYDLSWSHDGQWLAYSSQGNVKTRPEGSLWEADFVEILEKASVIIH